MRCKYTDCADKLGGRTHMAAKGSSARAIARSAVLMRMRKIVFTYPLVLVVVCHALEFSKFYLQTWPPALLSQSMLPT